MVSIGNISLVGGIEGSFAWLCLLVAGLSLCAFGALALVSRVAGAGMNGRTIPVLSAVTRSDIVNGASSGVLLGIGCGLLGGMAFEFAQSHMGYLFFLPPYSLLSGLFCGLGLGMMCALSLGRLSRTPRSLAIGLVTGMGVGLLVFLLRFGVTAGYGPDVGEGIGGDVALVFALSGGLLGALLSVIVVGIASRRTDFWRRLLSGSAIGIASALLLAFIGSLAGVFTFMLPYAAQVGMDTSTPQQNTLGLLYGYGVFSLIGLLLGGIAGGLSALQYREVANTSADAGAGSHNQPHWATFTPALFLGLLSGLSIGLLQRYVGGPLIMNAPLPDTQAGQSGLIAGLCSGVILGAGVALLWHRAEKGESRQGVARSMGGIALIVAGLIVISLPYWFVPLIGLSIH